MTNFIKPKKLTKGSKILTLSLSWGGPHTYPDKYFYGKKQFEDTFGVEIVEGKYTFADPVWLYNNPAARAEDLMNGLTNSEIDGIVSTIGGEDSIRMLPFIDFDIIRNNPKIFLGYSDSTVTHFMFQKAGVVSFYGPSIMAGFAENGGLFPYMESSIQKTLFGSEKIGLIKANDYWTNERLDRGNKDLYNQKRLTYPHSGWRRIQKSTDIAKGTLSGGCVDIIPFLQGTDIWFGKDFWINKILILEPSEEMMSAIQLERVLRNLGSQSILQSISGILMGRSQINKQTGVQINYDDTFLKIISGELGLKNIPIVTNMDFGHTDPMLTIPLGIKASIDSNKEEISFLENACL